MTMSLDVDKPDRRLLDVFMFNGEYDLLELRLLEHWEYVDRFFLVECRKTFTGLDKPLYYQDNKQRYLKYQGKIQHLIIEDIPPSKDIPCARQGWEREYYCRNYAAKTILDYSQESDYLIISDLDEIINPTVLKKLCCSRDFQCYSLWLDCYYYNCNWIKRKPWKMSIVVPVKSLVNNTMQRLRVNHLQYPPISEAGWHLSYFMTHEEFKRKLAAFSHTEFNKMEFSNEQRFQQAMETGIDVFSRGEQENCLRASDKNKLPQNIGILPKYLQRTVVTKENESETN